MRESANGHRTEWWVALWALVLAVLIGAPWFASGYILSYDMVWVPDPALNRSDVWGLGSALPRAVPSEAVIALISSVIPAAIVQRLVLLGALVMAGIGAGQVVRSLNVVPRLAAVSLVMWSPFVAERLVMGHWPLLLAYAAMQWLVVAARTERPRWGLLTAALAAMAMSPTGGVIGAIAALVLVGRRAPIRTVLLSLALNAPWIVAGLLSADARSDGDGVTAFAAQAEGPLGPIGAVFALGGIWNADAALPSRGFTTTAVMVAAMWAIMLVGLAAARRVTGFGGLLVLAVLGLAVSLWGWMAPGALEWIVETIPGSGLLRDGTRFLILVVPLFTVLFAHGVARIMTLLSPSVAASALGCVAVALPLGAQPDLALGADGRLQPVAYPTDWDDMRAAIEGSPRQGDIVVLPFTSYRAPEWNDNRPVLDPAGKYFNRDTVVADDLIVSGRTVDGEDPRVEEVRQALEAGQPAALADAGVSFVVFDADAPADPLSDAWVADSGATTKAGSLTLYEIEGADRSAIPRSEVVSMVVAWSMFATGIAVGLGYGIAQRRSRRAAMRPIE